MVHLHYHLDPNKERHFCLELLLTEVSTKLYENNALIVLLNNETNV